MLDDKDEFESPRETLEALAHLVAERQAREYRDEFPTRVWTLIMIAAYLVCLARLYFG
jgi:hypothetical protein